MKSTTKTTVTSKVTNAVAKKVTPNLAKVTNQKQFLETYLRGTGRTLSAAQARANYGIEQLSARISELRSAGLRVSTSPNTTGRVAYSISARDVNGSRATKFAV